MKTQQDVLQEIEAQARARANDPEMAGYVLSTWMEHLFAQIGAMVLLVRVMEAAASRMTDNDNRMFTARAKREIQADLTQVNAMIFEIVRTLNNVTAAFKGFVHHPNLQTEFTQSWLKAPPDVLPKLKRGN